MPIKGYVCEECRQEERRPKPQPVIQSRSRRAISVEKPDAVSVEKPDECSKAPPPPLTPPPRLAVQWSKVQSHLGPGGVMMPYRDYAAFFGTVSPESCFGNKLIEGLPSFVEHYWQQMMMKNGMSQFMEATNPCAYVPWLGVFQCPETFSKNNAREPVSDLNKTGVMQYPAIFYLPIGVKAVGANLDDINMVNYLSMQNPHRSEHNVMTVALNHGGGGGRDGYMEQLIRFYRAKGIALPDGARLIEAHHTPTPEFSEGIIMVCLKIAVGMSRPWWVNAHHIRLLFPLSWR